ncbi:MAG TPA: four helix bundle protein [Thermoanaerobaculia bacterium]|nr:four helix bundle protein [Thermoanaerobaculia bacterium]
MDDFNKLKVWQKSYALTLLVYESTRSFPSSEQYGLTSQMRRSSFSIPTNLAEGCGRNGDRELARFARISMGSSSELECQLRLAKDLKYLDEPTYTSLAEKLAEVRRMLQGFLNRLTGKERES